MPVVRKNVGVASIFVRVVFYFWYTSVQFISELMLYIVREEEKKHVFNNVYLL